MELAILEEKVTFQPVTEVKGHDNSQPEARRRQKKQEKRGRRVVETVVGETLSPSQNDTHARAHTLKVEHTPTAGPAWR